MPNKKLIFKKLGEIVKQLGHLKILVKMKEKQLIGDVRNFYFAERVMERLIGAALDINMHIVADLTGEVPENYFDSFTALAKLKILPSSFAKRIALSTSLRNILVHEYQTLDTRRFCAALKRGLVDYSRYVKHIEGFLG